MKTIQHLHRSFLRAGALLLFLLVAVPGLRAQNCQGCVPQLYFTFDSLNPTLYTFYDTTTYLYAPTSDSWTLNNVIQGSGSFITLNLSASNTIYYVCRNVIVPGCTVSCPQNACINIAMAQLPGIHINIFDGDSTSQNCTTPQTVHFGLVGTISGYPPNDSTIAVHIYFGDGSDTSFMAQHWISFGGYVTHVYQDTGTYNPQVIVYSPDSFYTDTMVSSHPIVITDSCEMVSGHVYLDNNSNCIFDAGDAPMAWRTVYLTNGAGLFRYTYADSSGFYSFNVPTGQIYMVTVSTAGYWYSGNYVPICPASGNFTVNSLPSLNNDFYLGCPNSFDLSILMAGWRFVPGQTGSVCVCALNYSCPKITGQIQVILDPLLTAIPDSNYSISGDTVTWNATSGTLCVHVVTSTSASIGDTVCVTTTILPIIGDSIPSNNTQTLCWAVRASWDPNDKVGVPEGVGVSHAIRPEQELTYTIRFQNTGTATAQDIYILDSLDADLDVTSYEVIASSHAVAPSVLQGNILRLSYPNINLPDSNANELMSHGYVTYRISPLSNVAHGALIHNTADIYFDFNPAVRTNSTLHTIDFFLDLQEPVLRNDLVTVYPNPAHDRLWITLANNSRCEVKLYDATGRLVAHQTLDQSGSMDVQSLNTGLYTLQVIQNDAMQNARLMIAR